MKKINTYYRYINTYVSTLFHIVWFKRKNKLLDPLCNIASLHFLIFTTRNTYLNVLEHKFKIEMLNITFTIIHVKHIFIKCSNRKLDFIQQLITTRSAATDWKRLKYFITWIALIDIQIPNHWKNIQFLILRVLYSTRTYSCWCIYSSI